ncbi:unnamed protein product [Brassicogethes aeneus]|uniref:F-box domain-containing protein n=1 Tax=Brassicogethes aeneus TaxID=1431903 RepID=A0A9P0FLQ5_BRAAE|nr:unnamed protein product [Brassicogethes aeneus]
MNSVTIDDLSTEILLQIFKYVSICDLCRLRKSCKRFNEIINFWGNVIVKRPDTLVTNEKDQRILQRSHLKHNLNILEKIRIEKNWINGKFKKSSFLVSGKKYMPWLQMNEKFLWVSQDGCIHEFKKNRFSKYLKSNIIRNKNNNADIVKFKVNDNSIVLGRRDGSISLWSIENKAFIFDMKNCHKCHVNCVDISNDGTLIVSGSDDDSFSIWQNTNGVLLQKENQIIFDRIWSCALLEDKSIVAVGTSGNENVHSLVLFDVQKNTEEKLSPGGIGAAVFDIKWESPQCVWSCGYDGIVSRWDLRLNSCVQSFKDPFGVPLYCMELDFNNTVMAGTQMHSRVALWDTRQQQNCVQIYFTSKRNSPVYSLSFDSKYLFTAIDQGVNVLDFSVYFGKSIDYSKTL